MNGLYIREHDAGTMAGLVIRPEVKPNPRREKTMARLTVAENLVKAMA